MFPKNWLPKPSPLLAPFTRPAISTNSSWVGIIFLDSADSQIPNNFDFWKLISQSDNQISYNLIINYEKFKEDSSKIDEMINSYSTEYEYIISPLSFDLPIIVTQGAVNVYEI